MRGRYKRVGNGFLEGDCADFNMGFFKIEDTTMIFETIMEKHDGFGQTVVENIGYHDCFPKLSC